VVAVLGDDYVLDPQHEQDVPIGRIVGTGRLGGTPEGGIVKRKGVAPQSALSAGAAVVMDAVVKRIRASLTEIPTLRRRRLHEQEEETIADDRGHGMDPWCPTMINRGEVTRVTVQPTCDELRQLHCVRLEVRP